MKYDNVDGMGKWTKWRRRIIYAFFMGLLSFSLISLLSDSFKPTASWIKGIQLWAIEFALLICFLAGWLYWVRLKSKNIDKTYQKLVIALAGTLLFGFCAYQALMYSVPMVFHQFSDKAHEDISVVVTRKEKTRRNRFPASLFICKYRLRFEHFDIPNKNFACASESAWNQVVENDEIELRVDESSYGYTIHRYGYIYKSLE